MELSQTVCHYLVRWGAQAEVGRFRSHDGTVYRRGQRALCQTTHGVFVGHVLSPVAANQPATNFLVRPLRPEDELLQSRLEKFKDDAITQCRRMIDELGIAVELVDVDHSFDGRTLLFYFLGDVPPEVEAATEGLAAEYERLARTGDFARLLDEGCGPGCGTTAKSGCATGGGCSTCSIAGACKK